MQNLIIFLNSSSDFCLGNPSDIYSKWPSSLQSSSHSICDYFVGYQRTSRRYRGTGKYIREICYVNSLFYVIFIVVTSLRRSRASSFIFNYQVSIKLEGLTFSFRFKVPTNNSGVECKFNVHGSKVDKEINNREIKIGFNSNAVADGEIRWDTILQAARLSKLWDQNALCCLPDFLPDLATCCCGTPHVMQF